jgi:6-phosphogluconate dehydrogenase
MEIGIIGLGRMGGGIAQRLLQAGHRVVGFDLNAVTLEAAQVFGAVPMNTIEDLAAALEPPRIVWVMLPAGAPTEVTLEKLATVLEREDIVVDGGNSYYKDSVRRAAYLSERGIDFVDVGTSGGIWGLREGFCLMAGGEKPPVDHLQPILEALAPGVDRGWAHVGPAGAGHFVKMVHNGIEYGLMQAYAEGFEIMRAKSEFGLDLAQISEVWRHSSVVRSWLLDLTAEALKENPNLEEIRAWVADSGEGRWTVKEAIDLDVPAPVITSSLMARFVSRRPDSYGAKLLAALRFRFGGHEVGTE